MRTSTLHRDLSYRPFCGDAGELQCPGTWTGEWVKHRLAEAFTIERRIPDKRVGPALLRNTWKVTTVDTFPELVAQGEAPREAVWEKWARAGGATSVEVSRMEEALSWPGAILANGGDRHAVEARCLLAWAFHAAYGKPLRRLIQSAAGPGRRSIAPSIAARRALPTTSTLGP